MVSLYFTKKYFVREEKKAKLNPQDNEIHRAAGKPNALFLRLPGVTQRQIEFELKFTIAFFQIL